QACSTTSLSTISRARSVESSGDSPPPLCAAKRVASCAKSVSKWASPGWPRSTPVALRLGFDGSGCGVGDLGITGQQEKRESPSVAEFRPKTAGCQYVFGTSRFLRVDAWAGSHKNCPDTPGLASPTIPGKAEHRRYHRPDPRPVRQSHFPPRPSVSNRRTHARERPSYTLFSPPNVRLNAVKIIAILRRRG